MSGLSRELSHLSSHGESRNTPLGFNKQEGSTFHENVDFFSMLPRVAEVVGSLDDNLEIAGLKLKLNWVSPEMISSTVNSFYRTEMVKLVDDLETEIVAVLGDRWIEQRSQSGGTFAVHSLLCLWRATKEPLFADLSKAHQNVVKWACFCHDLKKLGTPTIFGRDHTHPFKSAVALIELFQQREVILGHAEQWDQVKRLLSESIEPLPAYVREDFKHGKPVCTVMHSHQNLDAIFDLLWSDLAPRGSFVDLVLRIVMFHQSVEGNGLSKPMKMLSQAD